MRFSIVVPVYNCEKYLIDCLESICKQSFRDFELILIDDGSTDSSGAISEAYALEYKNCKVFHERNEGPFFARRKGVENSRGDYIVFVDGDDYLIQDALAIIDYEIEKNNSDIVLYGFSRRQDLKPEIPRKGYLKAGYYAGDEYERVKESAIQGYLNSMWMKAVRRIIFDLNTDYSKYTGIKYSEDLLQTLSIVDKAQSLSKLDNTLYYYRENDESSTSSLKIEQFDDVVLVNRSLIHYGKLWGKKYYDCALVGEAIQYINLLKIIQGSDCSWKDKKNACNLLREKMEKAGFFTRARIANLRFDQRVELLAFKSEHYHITILLIAMIRVIKNSTLFA